MKNRPSFFYFCIFFLSILVLCSCGADHDVKAVKEKAEAKEFCVKLKFADHTFQDEDMLELGSGDFILCGRNDIIHPPDTRSIIEKFGDFLQKIKTEQAAFIKLDAAGNLLWEKKFPMGGLASSFKQLVPGKNNTFFALKSIYRNVGSDRGAEILQLDSGGKVLKDINIHLARFYRINKMALLPDGDFILAGSTMDTGFVPTFRNANYRSKKGTVKYSSAHSYLARVKANGAIKWENDYDDFHEFEQVTTGNNAVFYVTGNSLKGKDRFVCGVNVNDGELLWQEKMPLLKKNDAYPMTSLADGSGAIFINRLDDKDDSVPVPMMFIFDPSGKQMLKKDIPIQAGFYVSSAIAQGNEIVFSAHKNNGENNIFYGVIDDKGSFVKNHLLSSVSVLATKAIRLKTGRFLIIQEVYDTEVNANIQYLISTNEKGEVQRSRDSI